VTAIQGFKEFDQFKGIRIETNFILEAIFRQKCLFQVNIVLFADKNRKLLIIRGFGWLFQKEEVLLYRSSMQDN
jgi:hypothetical protein